MKLTIDTDEHLLICHSSDGEKTIDHYNKEAFELVSSQWVRVGWACKYPYAFSWIGRPIIQLPEDMIRVQEVIYTIKPGEDMRTFQ